MTQPEALRLADYLTDRNRLDLTCDEAAAELRRLHDEVTELQSDLVEEVLLSNAMLEVKEELLAVLKTALPELDDTTWEQARAAIAKGEAK
jgi:hypothetical protein